MGQLQPSTERILPFLLGLEAQPLEHLAAQTEDVFLLGRAGGPSPRGWDLSSQPRQLRVYLGRWGAVSCWLSDDKLCWQGLGSQA